MPLILQFRSGMSRFGFGFDALRSRPGAWIVISAFRIRPRRADTAPRRGHADPPQRRPCLSQRRRAGMLAHRRARKVWKGSWSIHAPNPKPQNNANKDCPQAFHACRALGKLTRANILGKTGALVMPQACADRPAAAPEEDPCSGRGCWSSLAITGRSRTASTGFSTS